MSLFVSNLGWIYIEDQTDRTLITFKEGFDVRRRVNLLISLILVFVMAFPISAYAADNMYKCGQDSVKSNRYTIGALFDIWVLIKER